MSLTLGTQVRYSVGARWQTKTPITADTSYPAGGWALTKAQLGLPLGIVDDVHFSNEGVTAVGTVALRYDVANEKLMAFAGGNATTLAPEITATTNLSTALVNTLVVATGR